MQWLTLGWVGTGMGRRTKPKSGHWSSQGHRKQNILSVSGKKKSIPIMKRPIFKLADGG
jgi:hypothetical protein